MRLRDELSALATAFSFFTRFPVRSREFRPAESVLYLPLVGAFLGTLNFLAVRFLEPRLGPDVAAFGIMLLQYSLANYFHFDGLVDTLDALSAGGSRERRLRILKSPEVGALGLLFGTLFLLGQWLFLKGVLERGLPGVVFWKPLFGRWALLSGPLLGKAARKEGLGALFFSSVARQRALPVFLGLFLLLFWFFRFPAAVLFFVLLALNAYFRRVFGGLTGDLLGALCEVTEFLFLFLILI
ncbi:adenosylcobinamide-GDP ribazoletransferase [Thermosulfurimonas sp. F29]|uniref:adenosylcobinamide-GDP ribazoletransferase n=1 Tax=Thermosulfurimonas sp. F29 TaxID=2867247 RepID=UPI001C831E98|nr:adenosylcobinamide-GDP ribazoletransferase [Thermosulfurimonas sp. F29]MBX6422187.1 adenosylcobinamide-GDP ribazoletransferase [Thermosulfurimonas sp. F29]